MTANEILLSASGALILIAITYNHIGWQEIKNCYKMWFTKEYWTNYNTVEAAAWLTKATIIIPALIFGHNIWQLYILSLITSLMLIWASNKKLLPTLVGFNTLWIWLSLAVIVQNI
jgi:hypothetical protein